MIIIFIILAFIIGVYLGFTVMCEYIYGIHRINEKEYRYLGSFKGFWDILWQI